MKASGLFLLPLLALAVSCYPGETPQEIPINIPDNGGGIAVPNELYAVVTTVDAGITDATTATTYGSWSEASGTIREAGFQLSTNQSDLGNHNTYHQATVDNPNAKSGEFYVFYFECLQPSTTYYYRAYVQVQSGDKIKEFVGEVKDFTTPGHTVTQPSGSQPGWAEVPVMNISSSSDGYMINSQDNTQYYAWHFCPDFYGPGGKKARNYTVCYSAEHHCPLWVAAPRHSSYETGTGRSSYSQDPDIPGSIQYSSTETGGGCNKGHMLGSAERTVTSATNKQVFYYSNIAPQLSANFNTGSGRWNVLEDKVDGFVCSDTLYVVIGCYFDDYTDKYGEKQVASTISFGGRDDVSMPTMFYYVLLRTKSGSSGKAVQNCTASELKCVAFVRSHVNVRQAVTAKELMSVSDLEKITGVTYFPNVPNAPKNTFSASDWGL